jgi:gliding motility-associatede transport system auxiliary component
MNDAPITATRRRGGRMPRPRFAVTPDAVKGPLAILGVLFLLAGIGYFLIFSSFDTTARILTAAGILLVGIAIAIDPEAVWNSLTTRNMLYGGNTIAMAAILIGILVLINYLGTRQPARWDLTANQQFTLSEETLNLLNQISQPIQAIAFYAPDDTRRRDLEDRLREYQNHANGQLSYQFVDPIEAPALAQQLGVRELGTTVLQMGDQKQQINATGEADLTSAILKLVQPNPRKAYFTIGHDERRTDGFDQDGLGQLKTQLESRNFTVDTLNLFTTPEVPADASVVVIAGPQRPFSPDEANALGAYLDKGGSLFIMVDPGVDSGLDSIVNRWGVKLGQNYVVETDPTLVAARSPFLPVVQRFPNHKVTERMSAPIVFIAPTNLTVPPPSQGGATVTSIAQTSPRSWAETDPNALKDPQSIKLDEGVDTPGPLTVAVAIEQSPTPNLPPGAAPPASDDNTPKARVFVVGTSQLASNQVFQFGGAVGNANLALNAATWLAHDDQLISIKAKPADNRTLFLTGAQQNFVLLSTILFLPALVLAAGVMIWWSRR